MIWRPNGLNHMALIGVTMSNPDRITHNLKPLTHATVDQFEPIAPRTRINLKQLANGKWQSDITIESYDADPLTADGRERIRERLFLLLAEVDALVAEKEARVPS